jgi:hypothetical protein
MHVDEARRHYEAGGVNNAGAAGVYASSHRSDCIAPDSNVSYKPRIPGPVDTAAGPDDHIEYRRLSRYFCTQQKQDNANRSCQHSPAAVDFVDWAILALGAGIAERCGRECWLISSASPPSSTLP